MFCAQCGTAVRDQAKFCQGCGATLAVHTPTGSQTPPAPRHQAASAPFVVSPPPPTTLRFEFDRLGRGDLVSGIATLVLLISLFLPWYSADGFVTINVLDVRGWMYLVFLIALAIVAYLVLRALWAELRTPIAHWQIMISATSVNLLLTVIAFLARPAGFTWSVGPFLAIIAGVAAVVGALVRRNEPERLPVDLTGQSPEAPFWTTPAPVVQPVPAKSEKSCATCGGSNPADNRFCSTCGTPIS